MTDYSYDKKTLVAELDALVTAELYRTVDVLGLDVPEHKIGFYYKGRSAGTCTRKRTEEGNKYELEFNVSIYERHKEEFVNTIRHEIAHMIQMEYYPLAKQAHGKEFRKIHIALGGNGSTYHNFNIEGLRTRAVKRHTYTCPKREHVVSTRTHNQIRQTSSNFKCKCCKSEITFKETIVLV